MDSTEWHRWSVQQREAHLKKFRRAAVEIPFKQSVVSGTQGIANTQRPQLKPLSTLTISVGDVQVPGIPDATIEGIWSKAAAIISKSDAIVSAPGSWWRVRQQSDPTLLPKKSPQDSHVMMVAGCGCLPAYVHIRWLLLTS